jgi:hypothetical protein
MCTCVVKRALEHFSRVVGRAHTCVGYPLFARLPRAARRCKSALCAWAFFASVCSFALAGCVEGAQLATRAGLAREDLQGTTFLHRVYSKGGSGDTLYIFIEGDGTPWIDGRREALDPTPRDPLTLKLMLRTPEPGVYVGRPCYLGVVDSSCVSHYWTHGRYSPVVIESMAAVVAKLLARARPRHCVLVGHSGGGAIALLVAPAVGGYGCAVVTVAGLVDTEAWTDWHGYERLEGSLNPAAAVAELGAIPQIHLLGERDRNIPPAQTRHALRSLPAAELWEFPKFDHGCCWERSWPSILERLRAAERSAEKPQGPGGP